MRKEKIQILVGGRKTQVCTGNTGHGPEMGSASRKKIQESSRDTDCKKVRERTKKSGMRSLGRTKSLLKATRKEQARGEAEVSPIQTKKGSDGGMAGGKGAVQLIEGNVQLWETPSCHDYNGTLTKHQKEAVMLPAFCKSLGGGHE